MAFQAKERKCLIKIELVEHYPEVVPKVTMYTMLLPMEGARDTRVSGVIKEQVLRDNQTGFELNRDF